MFFFSKKNISTNITAGFTMVELMISIAIMVVILGVVMFNYRSFDSGIILTNLAFDVGLTIREAQSFGVSVKAGDTNSSDTSFTYPYGVHFDRSNKTQYTVFVDLNRNGLYDNGEIVKTYTLKGGYSISDLCTKNASTNAETCGNASTPPNTFDITFVRPNPDASIFVNTTGPSIPDAAEIKISPNQNPSAIKTITVRSTGQISVQ
jgi:prepilin-type N-terminal cleavage/methylation domain-containing protein